MPPTPGSKNTFYHMQNNWNYSTYPTYPQWNIAWIHQQGNHKYLLIFVEINQHLIKWWLGKRNQIKWKNPNIKWKWKTQQNLDTHYKYYWEDICSSKHLPYKWESRHKWVMKQVKNWQKTRTCQMEIQYIGGNSKNHSRNNWNGIMENNKKNQWMQELLLC